MDSKINEWLQQFEIVNEMAVHTEKLSKKNKELALQRTGQEDLPLDYVGDKGWKKQYQYMLLLKNYSDTDIQRLLNLDWLDKLSDLFYQANLDKDYPELEGNKKVVHVDCANALTYQEDEDSKISIYSLQLYFNVRGGM